MLPSYFMISRYIYWRSISLISDIRCATAEVIDDLQDMEDDHYESILGTAESSGQDIRFMGEYTLPGFHIRNRKLPFFITQTQFQQGMIQHGKLEGTFYDHRGISNIYAGKLMGEALQFEIIITQSPSLLRRRTKTHNLKFFGLMKEGEFRGFVEDKRKKMFAKEGFFRLADYTLEERTL